VVTSAWSHLATFPAARQQQQQQQQQQPVMLGGGQSLLQQQQEQQQRSTGMGLPRPPSRCWPRPLERVA
jgi:hypothetical protein